MKIDTTAVLKIEKSNFKLALLLFAAFVVIAISISIIQDHDAPTHVLISAWLILALSGASIPVIGKKIAFSEHITLILSPSGFTYLPISTSEISWNSITAVSTWTNRGTSFVRLKMLPEAFESLCWGRAARLSNWLGKKLVGEHCITISSSDLEIKFKELLRAFEAYARAHSPVVRSTT